MENDTEAIRQMSESITAACDALGKWTHAVIPQLIAAMAPFMLWQTDKRGYNLVKGKARRRLKLLVSQRRRGII